MTTVLGIDVGLRNLAFCRVRVEEKTFHVEEWRVLDVLGTRNAKKTTIQESVNLVISALLTLEFLEGVELVAIESQPVGRAVSSNVRMKVISHCIQTFFQLLGHTCNFVNPKSKMCDEIVKNMNPVAEEKSGDDATKQRYAVRKKAAIAAVATNVEDEWQPFWAGLKKKDDAADSLLIALTAGRPKSKKRKRAT